MQPQSLPRRVLGFVALFGILTLILSVPAERAIAQVEPTGGLFISTRVHGAQRC